MTQDRTLTMEDLQAICEELDNVVMNHRIDSVTLTDDAIALDLVHWDQPYTILLDGQR